MSKDGRQRRQVYAGFGHVRCEGVAQIIENECEPSSLADSVVCIIQSADVLAWLARSWERQGVRYTISGSARRNVLDRLLALNHERYEEEAQAGLHDKKVQSGARSRISGRSKLRKSAIQGELL